MKRSGLVFAAALSGLAGAALSPVPAKAQNMGGGFIEFLFGGGQSGAQPRYREQPAYPGAPAQPEYGRAPGYYQPGMYQDQSATPPMAYRGPDQRSFDPRFNKQVVPYSGKEKPGTIIVDTPQRFLYLVQNDGTALRYGIGVGRPGFTWAGVKTVTRKAEWPDWVPPKEMLARRPDLPHYMAGGPDNPLGARALYLGSSLYRIHGSNEPWTIGQAVSSGCIRMRNEDVTDLYERVKVGTRVIVI
ncbi:L,D-transpeptidase [Pseudorhodoplanes sp.]|uniref:L,D-transpeptidase family protein n=1 Tax=Pseudorhodoplanes sp. TaxID=1934341 RepID=UPI002CFD1E93|nr:L,D-transpeptidase [Pseudorhodoplanes sp.]HWV54938.1 L,D-transpeptidase [Pseudorhodoplanes sp.]